MTTKQVKIETRISKWLLAISFISFFISFVFFWVNFKFLVRTSSETHIGQFPGWTFELWAYAFAIWLITSALYALQSLSLITRLAQALYPKVSPKLPAPEDKELTNNMVRNIKPSEDSALTNNLENQKGKKASNHE